jgi:DeoR/GlpR family transcriptional regulator of sugar metabolism
VPNNLFKTERQERILRLVEDSAQVSVPVLSQEFRVSEATIRRDLEELDRGGFLRRTHGGAHRSSTPTEIPFLNRTGNHAAEKRRIGQAAAGYVSDGETVFLGPGTTTVEVARALCNKKHITVITNSVNVLNVLAGDPNIPLIVLGGLLRRSELSLIGRFAEQTLKDLRADKAFIGALAFHPQSGLTGEYLPEALTDQAILRSASMIVVVADHTKLGLIATSIVAPVNAVHSLVTDDLASPELVARFRERGVHVVIA